MTAEIRKPVILAADDDEDAHLLLQRAVIKAGLDARVISVNDGGEAIQYLAAEAKFSNREAFPSPDLLLLDWKMPRVSGANVLEYIRKRTELRNFPVVVFSSSDNSKDVNQANILGCSEYAVKPANFDDLVKFVGGLATRYFGGKVLVSAPPVQVAVPVPSKQPAAKAVTSSSKNNAASALSNAAKPSDPVFPVKLSESPDIFRFLVEQAKDHAIFMLDREGYIRSWNEGGRRIHGYEPSEIIGKHFSTFYPQGDKDNEKPQFELKMAREMGRYEEEGWRVRKDGSRFWANVVITPLRDNNGGLYGFAKVTRDLTQRKLQEENFQRLLESEERFRLLVEQVKDYAIFILDPKGNIASWNQGARRIKGYTADEVIGRHFSIFYTPDALAKDHPARELTLAIRDGHYEEEGWRVRKDGTRFWASVVITALWDKRGNLSGFAKVTRDLTQRKLEEDALRQQTEELEAFAHTLSHDLRAPVRAVCSFAEMLKSYSNELSEGDKRNYIEKIHKAGQSMDLLIGRMLKLTQVSLGPAEEDLVPLGDVLDEAIRLLEGDILKTKAQLEIKQPLPSVRGNRTLLLQIFSNLLINALKFVREGEIPKVEVFAVKIEDDCEIHVKDNGVGIPAKFQESIFNIFNRGAVGESGNGSGVGLAIVKRAVERLHGSIAVKSKEGQGSDFIVRLPCMSMEPSVAAS